MKLFSILTLLLSILPEIVGKAMVLPSTLMYSLRSLSREAMSVVASRRLCRPLVVSVSTMQPVLSLLPLLLVTCFKSSLVSQTLPSASDAVKAAGCTR